jgi:outer membrane protein
MGIVFAALLAAAPAANADLKIGYVNAARVLDESPQAEQVTNKLKQEFSGRDKELQDSRKELKGLEDKMARNGAIMSDEERSKLEREILVKKRDLQNAADAFRDDLNLRRNDEMNKLLAVVQQAIEGIGKEQKYDLIVYEGVAYASSAIDLTDEVLKKLRAQASAPGGGASPKK